MTELDEAARRDERLQLRRLEIASFAEASTLVLLVCVAVPLKHFRGFGEAVRVMGPLHGLTFLTYFWIAVQTLAGGGWTRTGGARLIIGALVPFGGFFNLPFLSRRAACFR